MWPFKSYKQPEFSGLFTKNNNGQNEFVLALAYQLLLNALVSEFRNDFSVSVIVHNLFDW